MTTATFKTTDVFEYRHGGEVRLSEVAFVILGEDLGELTTYDESHLHKVASDNYWTNTLWSDDPDLEQRWSVFRTQVNEAMDTIEKCLRDIDLGRR